MRAENKILHPAIDDDIKAVAARIFQLDPAIINLDMGPAAIKRWDSLNHLRLVTEVERVFSLRLTMRQIQEIKSLADIARIVVETAT